MICKDCIHNDVCKYGEARSNGLYCTGEKCKQYQSADVVTKSEYDAVVSAVDNSTNEFLKLHDAYQNAKTEVETLKDTNEHLAVMLMEAKQEVAREIFKEFERLMENNEVWFGQTDEMREEFAELKKKYAEVDDAGK